ncbi:hypothetical protein [Streptomyces sp. Ru72]|uniref:hypothetical protein n=1 Tax=Streptomyces sp. Ru72 TaxID=2080747 RepID=UPI0015E287E4|nr:hypothetical protein [Streptomyces sp. Ru72]
MLLWDVWGVGARELYDAAAQVTAEDVSFTAVRALFAENDGLRTPQTVTSLAPFNGPSEVTVRG